MRLREAIEAVLPRLDDALVVSANGHISRASFGVRDRPQSFYMIGSMGLASSIGLGVALAQPDRRVVVFDGDGNVLMNLGTLALAAAMHPANLLHICFDNSAHASTGNQRTISAVVPLDRLALASGYVAAASVSDRAELVETLDQWLELDGPRFLRVRIESNAGELPSPRVEHDPPAIAARFRAAAMG